MLCDENKAVLKFFYPKEILAYPDSKYFEVLEVQF
jgi:hypothetical protein